MTTCPPQHYYDEDACQFVPYEAISFTGPSARRSIRDWYEQDTDGRYQRQTTHPIDNMRRARLDAGGSAQEMRTRHARHRAPTKPVSRAVSTYANPLQSKGRGWRRITGDHPNAIPCTDCTSGFVTPGFAKKRYTRCQSCRRATEAA